MERGPLMRVLNEMVDTDKELDIVLNGEHQPVEIRNVVEVHELHSSNGLMVVTRQNRIWIDASHVSAAWQARDDRVQIKRYDDLVTAGTTVHAFYVRYLLPIWFDVQCIETEGEPGPRWTYA